MDMNYGSHADGSLTPVGTVAAHPFVSCCSRTRGPGLLPGFG